jgi:hypothetical protein
MNDKDKAMGKTRVIISYFKDEHALSHTTAFSFFWG